MPAMIAMVAKAIMIIMVTTSSMFWAVGPGPTISFQLLCAVGPGPTISFPLLWAGGLGPTISFRLRWAVGPGPTISFQLIWALCRPSSTSMRRQTDSLASPPGLVDLCDWLLAGCLTGLSAGWFLGRLSAAGLMYVGLGTKAGNSKHS